MLDVQSRTDLSQHLLEWIAAGQSFYTAGLSWTPLEHQEAVHQWYTLRNRSMEPMISEKSVSCFALYRRLQCAVVPF